MSWSSGASSRETLLQRRVRREERRRALLHARGDDEERVHRLHLAKIALRDPEHLARDLLQGAHQMLGRTGDQRRAAVGGELAVARDGEDQQLAEMKKEVGAGAEQKQIEQ